MTFLAATTVSISVHCEPHAAYTYVRDPRHLPVWAPGFAKAVRQSATGWTVDTGLESLELAFAPENSFGVLDHRVTGGDGLDSLNPMRVISNGEGSEVLFTLFRPEGVSNAEFERDLELVRSDLRTLKRVLEDAVA